MKRQKDKDRLLSRIVIGGTDECWPWRGALGTWGYGAFTLGGRALNASRATYALLVGEIPAGMVVCHSCDNPACCNPSHLWVGTQADNIHDCNRKGRTRGTFASDTHPRHAAKLTPDLVSEAKRLHYVEGVSQTEIGRRLGVHSSVISRAVRGLTWGRAA
jgi:hypothetical protein